MPRHSWLGSTGGGGAWSLAFPGCGSWLRFPATPGLCPPAEAAAVSVGLHGGFLVVCAFVARRVCAWCLCWCVCRVCVMVAWVWMCLPCVLVCVRVCACVVCGGWFPRLGLVAEVGVGAAGVCRGWSLATPGGGSSVRFPATPGWVLLPLLLPLQVVVGAPFHSLLRALAEVPRHSWLGSTGGGGVRLLAIPGCGSWLRFPATPGWGSPAAAVAVSVGLGVGCFVVCVFVARRMCAWCLCWCVCRALVAVAWVWVYLPCVLVCVRACACVVCGGWFWRLGLAAGVVWVRLVCIVVGPSPLLVQVPGCASPTLLAGFRCRWWWVLLSTPG